MSVLLEFSLFPTDVGESKSEYVAKSIQIIQDSGISYKMGPMGTTLEGEWDEVMGVVKQCFDQMSKSSNRIYAGIKVDYRAGKSGRLVSKIESIEKKTGKQVNT
ncbi:MAG: MTH1187 family thiamine-binding protein [Spirochaetia bacterium]|nr:MTH1187 family thiamine-binding protein [Spirochaetia bacterium]